MQVVVGRIGKPHGLRGEVTVEPRTDAPEERFVAEAAFLTDPAERGPLTIEHIRFHQATPLVTFAGVADRTKAEALRGTLLLIETDDDMLAAGDDEFWDHQLIGLRAVDAGGAELGVVGDVIHLPAQDLLSIIADTNGEVLVPFVSEIVTDVDLAAGHVVIADPGGLFDESQAHSAGGADSDSAGGGDV